MEISKKKFEVDEVGEVDDEAFLEVGLLK